MFTSDSLWIDDLREELQRRQARVGGPLGQGTPRRTQAVAADEAVGRADTLVRRLLDQMNQALLGGRGSVWDAPAAWGVHLWYLVVTLLRDSRGTPYLKVQGRRLVLEDARLERRLQRALRAAFLEPHVYTPRVSVAAGAQDLLRPPLPASDAQGVGHRTACQMSRPRMSARRRPTGRPLRPGGGHLQAIPKEPETPL